MFINPRVLAGNSLFIHLTFERMRNKILLLALITLWAVLQVHAQSSADRIRKNAVRIDNTEKLSDSVYHLLSPFQIIMFGEMHGTVESPQFVNGLANLLTANGDSVSVGLEIPSASMGQFLASHTDSSIYSSTFFRSPPYESGKESVDWAQLISGLKDNPRVQLFFFDVNPEDKKMARDSVMYLKIKTQCLLHPNWKMIT